MSSGITALALFISPNDQSSLNLLSQKALARRTFSELKDLIQCDVHVFTDEAGSSWVEQLVPDESNFCLRTDGPEGPSNLSRRVQYAFETLFDSEYDRVLALAADTPGLSQSHVSDAIDQLQSGESRAVVGPSDDGGFYLLGLNASVEGLFEDIPFYSSETCERVVNRLRKILGRLGFLETLADIDRIGDWFNLAREKIIEKFEWILLLVRQFVAFYLSSEREHFHLHYLLTSSSDRVLRAPPTLTTFL